jgi:hypothetical protein
LISWGRLLIISRDVAVVQRMVVVHDMAGNSLRPF